VQLVNLFGDNFASFFLGKSPTQITLSGKLPNDYVAQSGLNGQTVPLTWFQMFVFVYDLLLRGSRAANMGYKTCITIPEIGRFVGYISSFSYSVDSRSDNLVPFSLTFIQDTGMQADASSIATVWNQRYAAWMYSDQKLMETFASVEKALNTSGNSSLSRFEILNGVSKGLIVYNADGTGSKVDTSRCSGLLLAAAKGEDISNWTVESIASANVGTAKETALASLVKGALNGVIGGLSDHENDYTPVSIVKGIGNLLNTVGGVTQTITDIGSTIKLIGQSDLSSASSWQNIGTSVSQVASTAGLLGSNAANLLNPTFSQESACKL